MSNYRGVRLVKGEPVIIRDPNGRPLMVVRYSRKHRAIPRMRKDPIWFVDIDPQINVELVERHIPLDEED